MSKVVRAINAMISNESEIKNVIRGVDSASELYFQYLGKHKWSISKTSEDIYFLHYYPGSQSLEELASYSDWGGFSEMITYSTKELGTREARESFSELYTIVQEKVFGMNTVLDEIIGNDFPF